MPFLICMQRSDAAKGMHAAQFFGILPDRHNPRQRPPTVLRVTPNNRWPRSYTPTFPAHNAVAVQAPHHIKG